MHGQHVTRRRRGRRHCYALQHADTQRSPQTAGLQVAGDGQTAPRGVRRQRRKHSRTKVLSAGAALSWHGSHPAKQLVPPPQSAVMMTFPTHCYNSFCIISCATSCGKEKRKIYYVVIRDVIGGTFTHCPEPPALTGLRHSWLSGVHVRPSAAQPPPLLNSSSSFSAAI